MMIDIARYGKQGYGLQIDFPNHEGAHIGLLHDVNWTETVRFEDLHNRYSDREAVELW